MTTAEDIYRKYEWMTRKKDSPGFHEESVAESPKPSSSYTPEPSPVRRVSCRVYPNGQFGVGFVPRPKKLKSERDYDRGVVGDIEQVGSTYVRDYEVTPDGSSIVLQAKEVPVFKTKLGTPLELSQPRKKYGLKGITGYGKTMVKNGGYVLDVACRGSKVAFCQMGTLTVPSYSQDGMVKVATNWHLIVKRFFEKCKRLYEKLGLRFDYVSVTEIQPGRWTSRGEIGLHVHFIFVAYRLRGNQWSLPDEWVRTQWKICMENYLGEESYAGRVNYRRETVHSSSAAYLAKYMSKGGEQVNSIREAYGESVLPSQWWSMSSGVRESIKSNTEHSRSGIAEKLFFMASENIPEYIRYCHAASRIESYFDIRQNKNVEHETLYGYGGMLTQDGMSILMDDERDARIKSSLPIPLTLF